MRGIFALAGAVTYLTIGAAFADPLQSGPGNQEVIPSLVVDLGWLRSSAATPDAARDDERGAFRAEFESFEAASVSLPGLGETPAGSIRATTLMLNGLYEYRNYGWRLKPYIGAGFGVIDINARLLGNTENAFIPMFQLKGGVNYSITQKLFGKLEYRWSQGSSPSLGVTGVPAKFQLKRGGFIVGLNYHLN